MIIRRRKYGHNIFNWFDNYSFRCILLLYLGWNHLADNEKKNDIMSAVTSKCGMQSEAKGLIMSLPIDSVMGI